MFETTNLTMEENLTSVHIQETVAEVVLDIYNTESVIQEDKLKMSLSPSKRKKTKKINVTIEGCYTIQSAAHLKETCVKLLDHFDVICLFLKNIDEIDLAALQLIHLLKQVAQTKNKQITCDSELSKEDRLLIQHAGLENLIVKQALTE